MRRLEGRPSDAQLKGLAKDLSSIIASSKVANNRAEETYVSKSGGGPDNNYPSNSYLKTPPFFKHNQQNTPSAINPYNSSGSKSYDVRESPEH